MDPKGDMNIMIAESVPFLWRRARSMRVGTVDVLPRSLDRLSACGGEALGTAAGMREVREVTACGPDGNGGLGDHLA